MNSHLCKTGRWCEGLRAFIALEKFVFLFWNQPLPIINWHSHNIIFYIYFKLNFLFNSLVVIVVLFGLIIVGNYLLTYLKISDCLTFVSIKYKEVNSLKVFVLQEEGEEREENKKIRFVLQPFFQITIIVCNDIIKNFDIYWVTY